VRVVVLRRHALWRKHRLKPHRQSAFRLSRDPRFAAKVADVAGFFMDRPAARWC